MPRTKPVDRPEMHKRLLEPEPDSVGARIRAARLARGMSQGELAILMRVSQGRISAVELGREGVSLERVARFAVALGCKPSAIDPRLA